MSNLTLSQWTTIVALCVTLLSTIAEFFWEKRQIINNKVVVKKPFFIIAVFAGLVGIVAFFLSAIENNSDSTAARNRIDSLRNEVQDQRKYFTDIKTYQDSQIVYLKNNQFYNLLTTEQTNRANCIRLVTCIDRIMDVSKDLRIGNLLSYDKKDTVKARERICDRISKIITELGYEATNPILLEYPGLYPAWMTYLDSLKKLQDIALGIMGDKVDQPSDLTLAFTRIHNPFVDVINGGQPRLVIRIRNRIPRKDK